MAREAWIWFEPQEKREDGEHTHKLLHNMAPASLAILSCLFNLLEVTGLHSVLQQPQHCSYPCFFALTCTPARVSRLFGCPVPGLSSPTRSLSSPRGAASPPPDHQLPTTQWESASLPLSQAEFTDVHCLSSLLAIVLLRNYLSPPPDK